MVLPVAQLRRTGARPVDEECPAPAECRARAWTRREALLEARGTGLLRSRREVVVAASIPAGGAVAGRRIDDVPVPPGWVSGLASNPLEEPA